MLRIHKAAYVTGNENFIEITELDVPLFVVEGEDAELRCHFNSSKSVYSVKWYKNDQEFFYFIPSISPPKREVYMEGINVDMAKSDGRKLVLRNTRLQTEGRFKCEVSSEWPHYYTADLSKFLTICVLPKEKPEIAGALDVYSLSGTINLSCTSAPSKPPSILRWFINEKEASPDMLEIEHVPSSGPVRQTRLCIGFQLHPRLFVDGRLTIRCSSIVATYVLHDSIYFSIADEKSLNQNILLAEQLEDRTSCGLNCHLKWELLSIIFTITVLSG